MTARMTIAMNMICRLRIGPEESNSKSMKLSVRVKSSLTMPTQDSK